MKFLCLLAFVALATSVFGCEIHGCECPEYQSVNSYPDFEERSYPELIWITAESTSRFGSVAVLRNKVKLMRYWYGKNNQEISLNCTYPTKERWIHKTNGIKVKTSFLLPSGLHSNPPVPIDPTVKMEREPPLHLVARKFSGYPLLESQWDSQAKILANSASKRYSNIDTSKYYACTYDPIWMPLKRTNEVWMMMKK